MNVEICEVGPRDGLQNETTILAPAIRAQLIERLASTGLRRIEAVSFVSPKWVPAMAEAEETLASLAPLQDVILSGLVLNDLGYDRFQSTSLNEVHLVISCSESMSKANTNVSVANATKIAERICLQARAHGQRIVVTLAVAFGCPFEGAVAESTVLDLVDHVAQIGPDEIFFADTIGVAIPSQVHRLVKAASDLPMPIGVHLHDTRNTGIACALEALDSGASVFDASIGGAGGCPFAPGASGNIATEDLVYVFEREGVHTGVDLDALIDVAHWLSVQVQHPLSGHLQKAGVGPVKLTDRRFDHFE